MRHSPRERARFTGHTCARSDLLRYCATQIQMGHSSTKATWSIERHESAHCAARASSPWGGRPRQLALRACAPAPCGRIRPSSPCPLGWATHQGGAATDTARRRPERFLRNTREVTTPVEREKSACPPGAGDLQGPVRVFVSLHEKPETVGTQACSALRGVTVTLGRSVDALWA